MNPSLEFKSKLALSLGLMLVMSGSVFAQNQYTSSNRIQVRALKSSELPTATVSLYSKVRANQHSRKVKPGDKLVVSDVATIYSRDPQLKDLVANMDLGKWPATGKKLEVSARQIKIRIQLGGLSLYGVRITGGDKVVVEGPTQAVVKVAKTVEEPVSDEVESELDKMIRQGIVLAAAQRHGVEPSAVFVEMKSKPQLSKPIKDPRTVRSVEMVNGNSGLVGSLVLDVAIVTNSQVVQGKVSASILVAKEVAVANRAIGQDEVISNRNSSLQRKFFRTNQIDKTVGIEIFGNFANRPIRPGQLLDYSDTITKSKKLNQNAVKVGDLVSATVLKNSVRLRMSGLRCKQAGRIGDQILVENTTSKKTFVAKVISANQVEVR